MAVLPVLAKGADLSAVIDKDIKAIQPNRNERPREVLNWKIPPKSS